MGYSKNVKLIFECYSNDPEEVKEILDIIIPLGQASTIRLIPIDPSEFDEAIEKHKQVPDVDLGDQSN